MRRFLVFAVAIVLVAALGACARTASDIDKMQPGTALTVNMKDGTAVSGRLVQVRPDALVVDPAEGGEWKTLSRDQIASVNTQQAAAGQPATGAPPAAAVPPGQAPGAQTPEAAPPPPTASNARPQGTRRSPERTPNAAAPAPGPLQAAPAPTFEEVTIPEGTVLHLRLENAVASDTSRVEDPVTASMTKPIVINGVEAIPEGSSVKGVVTDAQPSGRVKGRAQLAFRFNSLTTASGQEHRISTNPVAMEAESTVKKDALKVGVGAGAGAIIGGIVGGGKGAAIGTAVGGGAGTASVLATKGKEVRLGPGATVNVKLQQPLVVRVPINR